MKCPKCRHYMRDDAQIHSCGWTSAVPLALQCAHEGCLEPAIILKKLSTGWANLCKAHDLFHVQQEADKFCADRGLVTREQKMEWIRKTLNSPRPTPREHWEKVMKTPGLIPISSDICNFLIGRRPKATKSDQMDIKRDSLD